jgi:hypothetical protein
MQFKPKVSRRNTKMKAEINEIRNNPIEIINRSKKASF